METDGWPLGRPQDQRRGEFKLLPWFEEALKVIKEFERSQIEMLGLKGGLINTVMPGDNLNPDIEGTTMTFERIAFYEDARGVQESHHKTDVMVLLVIPPELCRGAQTAICKRLDGNGSSLKSFADWVANAGIAAGIDPDEKIVIATRWELS